MASRLMAAPSFDLNKVTLNIEAEANEATRGLLTITPEWDWGWLRLDLNNRIYLTPADDSYSSFKAKFYFPELANRLKFDLDYQWNDKYRVSATGGSYSWNLRDLKLGFEYEVGSRDAVPDYDDRYRYHWDRQGLDCDYYLADWHYGLSLKRLAKVYPEATYYTSERLQLAQNLVWELSPATQWRLDYDETIADYPYDDSLKRSYWKDYWQLQFKHGRTSQWRWSCKYGRGDWDQGIEAPPYRDSQELDLELASPTKRSNEFKFKLRLAKLDYYSNQSYTEPDEELDEDLEDLSNRFERKIALEWQRHYNYFSWGLEFMWRNYDYRPGIDSTDSGIVATMNWKLTPSNLSLELAPWGSLT